ncbi:aminodeoxychorismate lyase [Bacteroidia bacterium]|nr:aminodeoxychorismate lyase [Bacteroidia bacterium]
MAKNKKVGFIIAISAFVVAICLAIFGRYETVLASNVKDDSELFIPTGATYANVLDSLSAHDVLHNIVTFQSYARIKGYPNMVKRGHYRLRKGMSNRHLVALLQSGQQVPVRLTFTRLRSLEHLAARVGNLIEVDSTQLIHAFYDSSFLATTGFNEDNVKCIFIANTYDVWWTSTASEFVNKMYHEYRVFWNDQRKQQAQQLGLTPEEVIVLASIVEEETNKNDEKPMIARVYLNRLNKGMRLQADPTARYAVGNFQLRRILNTHLKAVSPYNTYLNLGLPPGPICTPSTPSIESVLNAPNHDYMYFCAKYDFSGYHSFARNYSEHLANARLYRQALGRRLKEQQKQS